MLDAFSCGIHVCRVMVIPTVGHKPEDVPSGVHSGQGADIVREAQQVQHILQPRMG